MEFNFKFRVPGIYPKGWFVAIGNRFVPWISSNVYQCSCTKSFESRIQETPKTYDLPHRWFIQIWRKKNSERLKIKTDIKLPWLILTYNYYYSYNDNQFGKSILLICIDFVSYTNHIVYQRQKTCIFHQLDVSTT